MSGQRSLHRVIGKLTSERYVRTMFDAVWEVSISYSTSQDRFHHFCMLNTTSVTSAGTGDIYCRERMPTGIWPCGFQLVDGQKHKHEQRASIPATGRQNNKGSVAAHHFYFAGCGKSLVASVANVLRLLSPAGQWCTLKTLGSKQSPTNAVNHYCFAVRLSL